MTFKQTDSGVAAAVFFALYSLYSVFMIYVLYKKGFKTVYTWLMVFPIIRFGSQLCGMIFAIVGVEHYNWLIAYLVLGAEGYFVLIMSAFTFIIHSQKHEYGHSWIDEPRPYLRWVPFSKSFSGLFHLLLIPANSLVIAGGTMLAGVEDLNAVKGKVTASKAIRTTGQSIFLLMTLLVISLASNAFQKEKIQNHFNLTVLFASPFLVVRGVFGILAIYIKDMDYFQFSNYDGSGTSHKLVTYEYVLSTTMEFVASLCLVSNFLLERTDKTMDARSLLSRSLDEAFTLGSEKV